MRNIHNVSDSLSTLPYSLQAQQPGAESDEYSEEEDQEQVSPLNILS